MKISYAITIHNELEEIKILLPFLIKNKDMDDEIVILFDSKNGNEEVLNYLTSFNLLPNVQTWRGFNFNKNFGDWKNKLNSYCKGDYIFQLDADEMISETLIKNLKNIINVNEDVDLFYFSRINIVDGITDDDLKNYGWSIDTNGWVNFPDRQGRLYKNGLMWIGQVHERIIGAETISFFPFEYDFSLVHRKDIIKQRRQNELYKSLGD